MRKMKEIRKDKGMNQIDLAEKSGVSLAWIRNIEQGLTRGVSLQIKRKIVKILEEWPAELSSSGGGRTAYWRDEIYESPNPILDNRIRHGQFRRKKVSKKDEQIDNFYRTNQLINESSKLVRDHIDNVLLPSVKEDARLIRYAEGIRSEFTMGDQQAKDWSFKAIDYLNNPTPPIPEIIPNFHFDGLGLFNDVLDHGWDLAHEEETFERIEAVIAKACGYGVSTFTFFSHLSSGRTEHKHLNYKSPWNWENKVIDFNSPSDRYWHLYVRFLGLIGKYKRQACPIGFMDRYTNWPFEGHNKQGYQNFKEGRWVHKWLAWRLTIEQIRLEMKPLYLPINEFNHRGDCTLGHWIAWWHREIWEDLVLKGNMSDLHDFHIDISESDFCKSDLVYHGETTECRSCPYKWIGTQTKCPKCGSTDIWKRGTCVKCRTHQWQNRKEDGRKVLSVHHKVGIKEDLERGHISLKGFCGSANERFKGTDDGSDNPLCVIIPVPGLSWRLGDPDQVYRMIKYAARACKDVGKEFIWGIYPMEVVEKLEWGQRAFYHVDHINWGRFEAAQKGFSEVVG